MAYKDRIKDAEPPILPLRPLPPKWWLLAPCITAALAISQFVINWQHYDHSHVGYVILVAGLSMMVLLLTFAIVRVRLHVSKQAQRYLAELESLNRVSAAANSRLGEGQAALDELVKSICTLLDLREATVCLKDERDPILHFVSAYGMRVAVRGRRIPLDRMKVVARCLQTKQMVAVDDISVTKEPINREMAREQGMQATMVVPLIVTDRALGVLILGDLRPRKFTDAEKRLALLWAAQAAAVITSNNLFERARRALANRKSLQKRLDNLHAMLIKLYRSEDLHVALQDMADALPGVLEVDTCTISIVTEPDLDLTITAATTGKYPREIIGMRIPRNTINYTWHVLSSHRMSVIENAANDDRLNLSLRKQMDVGSIIFIPLYASNNRPIGLLSLIRRQPSVFSEEVRELADHLSRRAAHAIETATLHQQTRRDAETKTMLLRELNHRVKNNLAGIVALLSLEQPELPPRARQWLDRAIGRIQMMSRTHDLFGTGTTEVNLRRLIEMLVPSLVVICPPRAKIKTDIESIEVTLHPQRAVSLVMVLHELCYNALSYGVGADGVMLIRARGVDGYRIAIDVVDDGSGVSTGLPVATGPAALKSGSGLGLMLVRELVRTELHGVFSSAPNITGGLTATVEFPLKQKETELISL